MPTAFLAPAFLFGLLALAVPVFIHLRHRERAETVPFPSLMFLERIPYRSMRRRRLHNLALLALRALVFALLVLAFARPFLPRRQGAVLAVGGARERVILLDASYSMGYGGHFDRAKAEAKKAVEGLGPGDRAGLIVFSERAEGRVPPTADHALLTAGIDDARLSSGGTRYAPALKLAADWLAGSDRPRKDAVLLTDFQKVGFEGVSDVHLPAGASLTWVDLSERDPANLAVTDLVLDRDFADGRERVRATARLANKGNHAFRDAAVTLELADRKVEEKRVTVEPGSAISVAFAPFAFPAGETRGRVRLPGDALAADDSFHFVLAPGREVPLLVLQGETGSMGSLYLRRALEIGDRPRFKVEMRRAADLAASGLLPGTAVIVLGTSGPGEAGARVLAHHVEAGGGLLIVAGETSGGSRTPSALEGLLPGTLAAAVDRSADRGATLASLDHDHPAFALFKAPRSGDFSQARFLRYRALTPAAGARVLARFDDGSAALVESARGKGRVLVWTSGFDGVSSDLPLQPVFLPFIHELMKYLSGHADSPPWRRVAEVAPVLPSGASSGATVVSPSGSRRRLSAGERLVELEEAGFYEVRIAEGGAPPRTVSLAANVSAAESDLARLDPEEMASTVRASGTAGVAGGSVSIDPRDQEARQSVWWYLLAAALLLLLSETVFSNRPREAR